MKRFFIYSISVFFLACGSTQKATTHLQSGNYEEAFNTSVAELSKNKKANEKLIPILKEAYDKAAENDLAEIKALEKENTIESLKKIYGNYLNLDLRQDEVRVLEPLYYEGKEITFDYADYSKLITSSKNNYSEKLYTTALAEMKDGVMEARSAHQHLEDLIYVNPTYKNNLDELVQKAKNKGSSFVLVTLKNNVKSIKNDSLKDFTSINSSNFSNKWVIYHGKKEKNITYDHQIDVTFDKLTFEPEKTLQEKVPQEATIQDGWKYKLDAKGNVMKDDKGNDIKVANYITVRAEIILYQQNKASKLDGTITIRDLKNKKVSQPVQEFGEAKFQHLYGQYRGDQRAIEQKYFEALQSKEVPYPQDYLFINYSVSDFKQKLIALIGQQQF